jgi:hypothetical protein
MQFGDGVVPFTALHLVTFLPSPTAPHSAVTLWTHLLRFVGATHVPQRHQPQPENGQAPRTGLFESSASISQPVVSEM